MAAAVGSGGHTHTHTHRLSFHLTAHLVKQVSLLHQLLQKNDQNIRLGRRHGPRSVPWRERQKAREGSLLFAFPVPTDGRCILWKLGQGKVT